MTSTVATTAGRHQEGTFKYPSSTATAMSRSREERAACPLYTAIGVIDGRWKPMLFQRLAERPHGFGELRRAMPGVAVKVLREQLRQMQNDGLIARRPLLPAHRGVQYSLTPYGRTLGPVFQALWQWGVTHLQRRDAARGTLVKPPKGSAQAGS